MHKKTRAALVQRSFPTDLIDKIAANDHRIDDLDRLPLEKLRAVYTNAEVALIQSKIRRQPIDDDVVARILAASGEVCAYCADGNRARPYEIHHITPYAVSQDNSEDNLLLVCPTDHTAIHDRSDSIDEQKRRRRAWYSLHSIALEFAGRGVPFSYPTLVAVDFDGPVRPAEVLDPGAPSPATAKSVSQHDLAARIEARLRADNFVMLGGPSGSGKSTLALGVAGRIEGARVFQYRPPREPREALTEILMLIATVTKATILVLDDINVWASPDNVATLRKAASSTVRVLATVTEGTGSDATTERAGGAELVSWGALKDSVRETFLKNEASFIEELRSRRRAEGTPSVGLGYFDRSLASVLDEYLPKSKTVWEFAFLLGAGWRRVDAELQRLVADHRADVPVLVAAIEQIGGVEEPVAITECVDATNQALPAIRPPASADWVEGIFSRLVARRFMTKVRDRYTTVHRAWARALIVAALKDRAAGETTQYLLSRAFDVNRPRRVPILISWLRGDAAGFEFVRAWVTERDGRLTTVVGNAAAKGLVDLGLLASELHLLVQHPMWTAMVDEAFTKNEAAIVAAVKTAGPNDWHWLQQLFMAVNHACAETGARVVNAWDAKLAAAALVCAPADAWDDAAWFLAGVEKHSEPWCRAVGAALAFEEFLPALEKTQDLRTISRLRQVVARLHVPFRRSHLKALWAAMGRAFAVADLDTLRMPTGTDWDLEIDCDDIRAAVAKLDPARLAKQLTSAKPAHWGRLLDVTQIAARAGSDFPAKLSEHLDEQLVGQAIEHGPTHPYELRLLLWQLQFLHESRKEGVAAALYPAVLAAARNESEQEQLLRAFGSISVPSMERLARELGVAPPDRSNHGLLLRPFLDANPEARAEWVRLEETGEDYEVREIFGTTPSNA